MLNPKKLTNKQLRCNLDRFTGTQKYETSISHTFLVQRWIEKCH